MTAVLAVDAAMAVLTAVVCGLMWAGLAVWDAVDHRVRPQRWEDRS